jgi:hypothetical protein
VKTLKPAPRPGCAQLTRSAPPPNWHAPHRPSCVALTQLNLGHNRIERLEGGSMLSLALLTELQLQGNRLT